MKNPFEKKPSPYLPIKEQLFEEANNRACFSDEFNQVMEHIDTLDKIEKRSSDAKIAAIGVAGPALGIVGIYALQQFAGVIVPKALELFIKQK